MTDATTFEGMIGRALLGDDKEKELQLIRVDCKHYAMQKMLCDCGSVLDQKRTNILRDADGKDKAVCCDKCRAEAIEKFKGLRDTTGLAHWTFANWNGSELVCGLLAADSEQPKKPRAIPIWQLIRGKEQSERFKPLAIALHERHGLALNSGTLIIDIGQANSEAIVADDIAERVEMWAAKCRDLMNQQHDASIAMLKLGSTFPGTEGHIGETWRRFTIDDIAETPVCVINESFRLTAERHGKVTAWRYVPSGVPCVIGFDRSGKRRAVIACIDAE